MKYFKKVVSCKLEEVLLKLNNNGETSTKSKKTNVSHNLDSKAEKAKMASLRLSSHGNIYIVDISRKHVIQKSKNYLERTRAVSRPNIRARSRTIKTWLTI